LWPVCSANWYAVEIGAAISPNDCERHFFRSSRSSPALRRLRKRFGVTRRRAEERERKNEVRIRKSAFAEKVTASLTPRRDKEHGGSDDLTSLGLGGSSLDASLQRNSPLYPVRCYRARVVAA